MYKFSLMVFTNQGASEVYLLVNALPVKNNLRTAIVYGLFSIAKHDRSKCHWNGTSTFI